MVLFTRPPKQGAPLAPLDDQHPFMQDGPDVKIVATGTRRPGESDGDYFLRIANAVEPTPGPSPMDPWIKDRPEWAEPLPGRRS